MAKTKTILYCTSCGTETPKWQGRCPACGAWNTMVEHEEKPAAAGKSRPVPVGAAPRRPKTLSEVDIQTEVRFSTGMGELDRVLGGGAVCGSLVLVGGAPGIGKSTLLLQICACLCREHQIQKHQIRLDGPELGHPLASVGSQGHGVALLLQVHLQKLRNILIVLHD